MDAHATCHHWLDALTKRLGMEALAPDAEGRVALRLGRHETRLVCSAELEELFSLIRIAPLPSKDRDETKNASPAATPPGPAPEAAF